MIVAAHASDLIEPGRQIAVHAPASALKRRQPLFERKRRPVARYLVVAATLVIADDLGREILGDETVFDVPFGILVRLEKRQGIAHGDEPYFKRLGAIDAPDDALGNCLGAQRALRKGMDFLGRLAGSIQLGDQGDGIPRDAHQAFRGFPRRPVLSHNYTFSASGESFKRSTTLSR